MLGESAGRSAGNTPRASARRRNSDDERAQRTHLHDDPEAWPDEPVDITGWRMYLHDVIVAVAAAGWCLFLLGVATFSWGWTSRVFYGIAVTSYVILALEAFGIRRRSS